MCMRAPVPLAGEAVRQAAEEARMCLSCIQVAVQRASAYMEGIYSMLDWSAKLAGRGENST